MNRKLAWLCVIGSLGCGSGDSAGGAPDGSPAQVVDAQAQTDAFPADASTTADGSALDSATGSSSDSATDAFGDAASGPGPYGGDGPDSFTTATLQVPAPNGTFTVVAYIPGSAAPHPVVILSSGFFQAGAAYAPYARRLASWGMVTILRDDPNLAEPTASIAADVAYMVTTWLSAVDADASSPMHGKVDATRIGLAGHSRGGQTALLAAETGAHGRVRGVFGLDPVDTSMNGSPQARTDIAKIAVPVAFVGETTDSAPSSCAPATDNYEVLYAAAASPAVAITVLGADHTMFEDPAACSFCTTCTAGTANAATVLATSVRYLTAFFARELEGDLAVGPAFGGAGANQDVAAQRIALQAK